MDNDSKVTYQQLRGSADLVMRQKREFDDHVRNMNKTKALEEWNKFLYKIDPDITRYNELKTLYELDRITDHDGRDDQGQLHL